MIECFDIKYCSRVAEDDFIYLNRGTAPSYEWRLFYDFFFGFGKVADAQQENGNKCDFSHTIFIKVIFRLGVRLGQTEPDGECESGRYVLAFLFPGYPLGHTVYYTECLGIQFR